MNRRSLLMGVSAMAAVAACSPGLAPAAQQRVFPRAALTGMWPIIREMRAPTLRGAKGPSLEEIRDAVMLHLASYGIESLPARFEGIDGPPVMLLGFTTVDHVYNGFRQRELLLVFDYQSTRLHGPHSSHVAFETPTPLK